MFRKKRYLKAREIQLNILNYQSIELKEVNTFEISLSNKIGTAEGLTRNFIWPWHLGITTISVSGKSYIGAFLDEEDGDRIDDDVVVLKQALREFEDYTKDQKTILWVKDDSGDTEVYIGYFESFKAVETSESPYYITYDFVLKAVSPGEYLKDKKLQAFDDSNDSFLTRIGIKKAVIGKQYDDKRLKEAQDEFVIGELYGQDYYENEKTETIEDETSNVNETLGTFLKAEAE